MLIAFGRMRVIDQDDRESKRTIGVFNPALGPVQYRFESLATQ